MAGGGDCRGGDDGGPSSKQSAVGVGSGGGDGGPSSKRSAVSVGSVGGDSLHRRVLRSFALLALFVDGCFNGEDKRFGHVVWNCTESIVVMGRSSKAGWRECAQEL